MEYYIYLTYRCNLACSYCSSKKITSSPNDSIYLTDEKMNNIIRYIESNKNGGNDSVVFFGGEPILELNSIDTFINKTQHLNLKYIVYTNGILLNTLPHETLTLLDTIFISLDGDKLSHEKHRGIGTYDKIVDNLKNFNQYSNRPNTIGRITVEEDSNLFESINNVSQYVDSVYWQIVNKPNFKNSSKFIRNYKSQLTDLYSYWLENLSRGKKINIIPFIAITSNYIFNHNNNGLSFRCGAGNKLQAIDIDGNIYWCDEYVGDSNGSIGNISSLNVSDYYLDHKTIFNECNFCDVQTICLGRCRKSLMSYSKETIELYCELTKYLISLVYKDLFTLEQIISKYKYTFQTFYDSPTCTEEIP